MGEKSDWMFPECLGMTWLWFWYHKLRLLGIKNDFWIFCCVEKNWNFRFSQGGPYVNSCFKNASYVFRELHKTRVIRYSLFIVICPNSPTPDSFLKNHIFLAKHPKYRHLPKFFNIGFNWWKSPVSGENPKYRHLPQFLKFGFNSWKHPFFW